MTISFPQVILNHARKEPMVVTYSWPRAAEEDMHRAVEYSALIGTGWILSNVLFVVVWSWIHSSRRRWMDDPDVTISCFSTGQEELMVDALKSPNFVASMQALRQSEVIIEKAS